ncbi:MAG: hypothetical protein KAJ24_01755 [Candidatus Aenigmarchaeota archaeon]|nr:hypothetical protein [Candidatus Aenigmarchaeota archaeon]
MGKRNIMFGVRKGITPVIALVLLLMMTVAAAGMAYVWFMDVQEETQETVRDSLSQRTDQMAGAIVIDAVYETGAASSTDVIIRNTGSVTYTGGVNVFVGSQACVAAAVVNAPGDSAVVNCAEDLLDGMVIRAVPPQGSSVAVTCAIDGAGNDEYCVM